MKTTIPPAVKTAITTSIGVMLVTAAIPQTQIDAALAAFFRELDGEGTLALTNREPLDRALKPAQVADLLGRSTTTIKRMVSTGKLCGVYGGKNRQRLTGVSENSVRAFMEAGRAA